MPSVFRMSFSEQMLPKTDGGLGGSTFCDFGLIRERFSMNTRVGKCVCKHWFIMVKYEDYEGSDFLSEGLIHGFKLPIYSLGLAFISNLVRMHLPVRITSKASFFFLFPCLRSFEQVPRSLKRNIFSYQNLMIRFYFIKMINMSKPWYFEKGTRP